MNSDFNSRYRLWAKLVARAWDDEDFRQRLVANLRRTLEEEGLELGDMEYVVHQNSDRLINLVLPVRPELKEEWTEEHAMHNDACGCHLPD